MEKEKYSIIMIPLARWDAPYSSTAYSLAKELSHYCRFFFVDNPFTFKDFLMGFQSTQVKRRISALVWGKKIFYCPDPHYPNLVVVTPRLVFPINWLPKGKIYRWISTLNDSIFCKAIDHTIHEYDLKKIVLFNSFNPFYGKKVLASRKPLAFIYQSVDNINESSYVSKHGSYLEKEMIQRADLTVVTSSELKRTGLTLSKNVQLVPNGADVDLFQKAVRETLPKPPEWSMISEGKKVICYTGNICHRIDYVLLKKIAETHSDKILLMVGPVAEAKYIESGLNRMPNVIFAGRKDIRELPAYLQHSHCCIIPFLCNQLTRSIYPLKVNEYLSAGKPVVSTLFSEDIASFGNVISIANTHDDFVSAIGVAIAEDTKENALLRVASSAGNSWKTRAYELLEKINYLVA